MNSSFLQYIYQYALFILGMCFVACSHDSIDVELSVTPTTIKDDLWYKDSIIVMQWNIGHFSEGVSPSSFITDNVFYDKLKEYRQLINEVSADVISLCEYSVLFANTVLHPMCYADTALFYNYPYKFIGNNGLIRHYSLNAIMSKREIFSPSSIDYITNMTASITHTTAIKATDYYYNKTYIAIGGREVAFINTHLAFDTNNPDVAIDQVKELIYSLNDDKYVVICGDFNTVASTYSLFSDAGYMLANTGEWGTYPSAKTTAPLDNIISKGLIIRDAYVIENTLSDHYPLVCMISVVD